MSDESRPHDKFMARYGRALAELAKGPGAEPASSPTVARHQPTARELRLERENARLRAALIGIRELASGNVHPDWTDDEQAAAVVLAADEALERREPGPSE